MKKYNPCSKGLTYLCGGDFDESVIKFSLYSDDLDPDEISRIIRLKPTQAYKKGSLSANKKMIRRHGAWKLETPWISKFSFETNISRFLSKLPTGKKLWSELTSHYDTELTVVLRMRTWNRSATLSAKIIQELAKRKLSLGIDVYFDDDSKLWSEKKWKRT
ncbi:MAG: hypothetical protein A2283_24180 [Lentisphaerae bacterium RIFOXYA12_FULL_48_11]|nr:MAG: hypothetical protein A2283_24180 [Lentisphaerae bacterium RIFOXYA12_FULL_48_11]